MVHRRNAPIQPDGNTAVRGRDCIGRAGLVWKLVWKRVTEVLLSERNWTKSSEPVLSIHEPLRALFSVDAR
jgi:hypothetical protein